MTVRREELLEKAYAFVLEHGLADLSLRPLALAIGSSPRVLLYLFESKDGLVRELLARARHDELAAIQGIEGDLEAVTATLWEWLAAPEHRPLLVLWLEAYARSLVDPDGPWAGFARQTVEDWLDVLAGAQPRRYAARRPASPSAPAPWPCCGAPPRPARHRRRGPRRSSPESDHGRTRTASR